VATLLGRIGLATVTVLAVTDVAGLFQAPRTDVLVVPSDGPSALKVEIDPKLCTVSDPPTIRRLDLRPLTSGVHALLTAAGTRSNQQQWIEGQRNDLFTSLVRESGNPCFLGWEGAGGRPGELPVTPVRVPAAAATLLVVSRAPGAGLDLGALAPDLWGQEGLVCRVEEGQLLR
jgi:hypothetical protein